MNERVSCLHTSVVDCEFHHIFISRCWGSSGRICGCIYLCLQVCVCVCVFEHAKSLWLFLRGSGESAVSLCLSTLSWHSYSSCEIRRDDGAVGLEHEHPITPCFSLITFTDLCVFSLSFLSSSIFNLLFMHLVSREQSMSDHLDGPHCEADFLSITQSHPYFIYWWGRNCFFCCESRFTHIFCIIYLCVVMCVKIHRTELCVHMISWCCCSVYECMCVCVCVCVCVNYLQSRLVFLKHAPRLFLVGDAFGLMAAFLGLNGVYLIHSIDIPTNTRRSHTDTHTRMRLMPSLRVLSVGSRLVSDAADGPLVAPLFSSKRHHERDACMR